MVLKQPAKTKKLIIKENSHHSNEVIPIPKY